MVRGSREVAEKTGLREIDQSLLVKLVAENSLVNDVLRMYHDTVREDGQIESWDLFIDYIFIDSFFKNRSNFNTINLLFPHIWQVKPARKEKNYKLKMENKTKRRVIIIRELIEFIHRTKRFKREKYGI